jgi:hypothetical protein
METRRFINVLQEPSTGLHSEPFESILHHYTPLLKFNFNTIFSSMPGLLK